MKGPYFLCGMSRSGTRWLGRALNEHPNCAVYGESLYWGRNFIKPKKGDTYSNRELQKVISSLKHGTRAFFGDQPGCLKYMDQDTWKLHLSGIHNTGWNPGTLFAEINRIVSVAERKSIVVEKTPHHVNWVDRIVEYFPNAKFIIMLRDPYTFMRSYKHQGRVKDKAVEKEFRQLYHPLSCSIIWRRYFYSIHRQINSHRDRSLILRYEDVQKDSAACLQAAQNFLELENCNLNTNLDRNSSFTGKSRQQLQAEDVFWINLICRKAMKLGEYQKLTNPIKFSSIIISIFRLIPWSFYAGRFLFKSVNGNLFKYVFRFKSK